MVTNPPITPLEPFGVEVDLELSRELDPATRAALAALLWDRHLLLFRGQTLDFDQQVDVMSCFGPISRDEGDPAPRDFVSIDPDVGMTGSSRLPFHQDLACCPLPLIALSLFGLDVEPRTTSTLFIDSMQVYRRLPAELRDRLLGLEILHIFPSQGYGGYVRSTAPGGVPYDMRYPHAVHPLALAHPHTHEPILFVCEQTDRIVGLSDADSEALMVELFEHTYDPANVHEHWWEPGDLVVWDNLAVQHGRADQSAVARRTLRRVVCGEQSFAQQNPQMQYRAEAKPYDEPPVLVDD
jgi:taurine dioxygenase